MTEKIKLKTGNVSYTDSMLREIGKNVAMLYGASCIDYKIERKERRVYFDCIEFGERFLSYLDYKNLAEYLRG